MQPFNAQRLVHLQFRLREFPCWKAAVLEEFELVVGESEAPQDESDARTPICGEMLIKPTITTRVAKPVRLQ